jgi:2-hydroxy-3-oxopropionate reductase
MVGGDRKDFERCLPVFKSLGETIVYVGGAGAGQVAKACNQIVVGATIAAVAEALTLAEKAGVDAAPVREALMGGFARSRILEVHGQRMIDGAYEPGFRARLHQKDLSIALETARTYASSTPVAGLVAQLLNALDAFGYGDFDHAALALVYQTLAASQTT